MSIFAVSYVYVCKFIKEFNKLYDKNKWLRAQGIRYYA